MSSARGAIAGLLRLLLGALFAFASVVLVARTLAYGTSTLFSVFAIGTFLAGLCVDALLGEAVRQAIGIKR